MYISDIDDNEVPETNADKNENNNNSDDSNNSDDTNSSISDTDNDELKVRLINSISAKES